MKGKIIWILIWRASTVAEAEERMKRKMR